MSKKKLLNQPVNFQIKGKPKGLDGFLLTFSKKNRKLSEAYLPNSTRKIKPN